MSGISVKVYVKIGGRGLKNLTYPYMGIGWGVKNFQNHPYVINEWPLRDGEQEDKEERKPQWIPSKS